MAGAVASGVVKPNFVFAQGAPGRIKNYVDIFLYGGADARHAFPYLGGPVDAAIRARRPNTSLSDIRQLAGMDQQGRANPIGFHYEWQDLLTEIQNRNAGLTIVSEYGITSNTNTSHDIATQHFFNASSNSPASIAQGWLARAVDTYSLPSMTVWGVNVSQPAFFNAHTETPMVLTSLSNFDFVDRWFGAFDCTGAAGTACASSVDRWSSAADDSAYARSIARQLNQMDNDKIPLSDAIKGASEGIFSSVPIVRAMANVSIDPVRFRPSSEPGYSSPFALNMADVARILYYSNMPGAPETLRNNTKIIVAGVGGWDSHSSLNYYHRYLVRRTGGAIKGLVSYLAEWGLLNDTLITIKSEFARTTQENAAAGTDHAQAGYFILIGGGSLVPRRVIGPDASLYEAQNLNYFTPKMPITGLLKRILPELGMSQSGLAQVLPQTMPGEDLIPALFL